MRRFLYVLMRFPGGLWALVGIACSLLGLALQPVGVRVGIPWGWAIFGSILFGLCLVAAVSSSIGSRKATRMKFAHIRECPEEYFSLLGQLDERITNHATGEYMRKLALEDYSDYRDVVLIHDVPFGLGRHVVLVGRDTERVYDQVSLRDMDHMPVKFYEWTGWSSLVKIEHRFVPIKMNGEQGSVYISFMDTDPARVQKIWRIGYLTIGCMKPRENREDDTTKDAVDFEQISRFDYATCEELEELLQVIDRADNGTR